MAYIKGNDVLPETLLAEVQQYIDGAYLYIPRREGRRKPWGAATRSREEVARRNRLIAEARRQGVSVPELARLHCLSVKTVYKIVAGIKNGQ